MISTFIPNVVLLCEYCVVFTRQHFFSFFKHVYILIIFSLPQRKHICRPNDYKGVCTAALVFKYVTCNSRVLKRIYLKLRDGHGVICDQC